MIRLLIDKFRLPSTLNVIRNIQNVPKTPPTRTFTKNSNLLNQTQAESNLGKDVIMYKYDNPRFFKMLNFFAISQVFFWGYVGQWAFTSLRNSPVVSDDENLSWWRRVNLGESKYKNTLAATCFVVGYLVIFVSWTFTLKSVRYLIALKNGREISIVTYTPFGQNRIINVPLKFISAQESRQTAKVYLPIKVKDMRFFYIVDMKGEFKNTQLFDRTVGLSRKF